ncbi:MAG: hypothetical protein GF349_00370 [Candidatus Magasanikbacteria bacterium]|nr:hypothetical protein [Candidatus Magasanikbacteria bacterium]
MKKVGITTITVVLVLLLNIVLYYISFLKEAEGVFYSLSTISYLLSSLLSVVAAVYVVKIYNKDTKHGNAMMWILLGLFGWFAGELIWIIYEFLGKDPFPSIADLFFLLAYPAFFVGFLKEYRLSLAEKTKKIKWFNFMPLLILVLFFVYMLFYLSQVENNDFFEEVIGASYYFADLILAGVLVFIMVTIKKYSQGRILLAWIYISVGMVAHFIADLLFSFMTEAYEQSIPVYTVIDMIWIIGFLFFACGLFTMGLVVKEVREKLIVKK